MKAKYKIGERVVIWSLPLTNRLLKRFSKDNQEYFLIGQIIVKNSFEGRKKICYLLHREERISSEIIEVDEEILATAYWANDFFNIKETIEFSNFEGEIIHFD